MGQCQPVLPRQLRVVAFITWANQCPGVQKEGAVIVVVRRAEHIGVGGKVGSWHSLGEVVVTVPVAIVEKEVDMGAMASAGDRVTIVAMRHCQHLGQEQAGRRGNEGKRPEHHTPLIRSQSVIRREN